MAPPAPPPRTVEMTWVGPQSQALLDTTRHLSLEGAFRSGKTTVGCWKWLGYAMAHPGIALLLSRWTDDATFGILRPIWRQTLRTAGIKVTWNAEEQRDEFPNGSHVYIRGLKTSEEINRYGKFRGLTLAAIWVDQPEELPHDVYLELKGRLSQPGYPHQVFLTPNPEYADDHWLATSFPYDNHYADHKVITISVYDNAHNLDADVIPALEAAYPPGTSKHRPAVLGLRGVKVRGTPVYQDYFRRALHVQPATMNPDLPLCALLDFGKHHPCCVWVQYTPWSTLVILGGVMGQSLFLEDFLPIVARCQADWFPDPLTVQWACDPAGSHNNSQGVRQNALTVLQAHGISPRYLANSNAPDVRRNAIERLAGYMRRRSPMGEAFTVDPDRWLIAGQTGLRPSPFMVDGLEAGYVWDEQSRQVGSKSVAVPTKDGWFEHAQNCLEYGEVNYGGQQPSLEQQARRATRIQAQSLHLAQTDPTDRPQMAWRGGRGGY